MENREIFEQGDYLKENTPIDLWLKQMILENNEPAHLYKFALENGKYFTDKFTAHPADLPDPIYCKYRYCHENSMQFIYQLMRANFSNIDNVKLVTGFYAVEANSEGFIKSKLPYYIGRHSFLTYNNLILDITDLGYPQTRFKTVQYWGVTYDARIAGKEAARKADFFQGPRDLFDILQTVSPLPNHSILTAS